MNHGGTGFGIPTAEENPLRVISWKQEVKSNRRAHTEANIFPKICVRNEAPDALTYQKPTVFKNHKGE